MIVAVIPACNEETRVAAAVAALRAEGVMRTLVLANGCGDATAARAAAAGAVVVEAGPLDGGVGEARALGCAAAFARWPDISVLISTDADSRVGTGCVAALRQALGRADAAMGRLVPDPDEMADLPEDVALLLELLGRRDSLLAELARLGMSRPYDPAPRHLDRAGALMAFRPVVYRQIGGFRPLRSHEDRDIAARLCHGGFRVAHPWEATVTVSCRTSGRAPDGMAAFLSARIGGEHHETIGLLRRQCRRLSHLAGNLRLVGPGAACALSDLVRSSAPASRIGLGLTSPGQTSALPSNPSSRGSQ